MDLRAAALATALLGPVPSFANELPGFSILRGSSGGGIIEHVCTLRTDGKLDCSFVQVLLTNQRDDDMLAESLRQIPDLLADPSTIAGYAAMCPLVDAYQAMRASGDIGDEARGAGLDAEQLVAALLADPAGVDALMDVLMPFCQEQNEQTLGVFMRYLADRTAMTCEVFIHRYDQTFVRVSPDLWVVESSPTGDCGIVNTSRFARDRHDDWSFWNYISSKVVTNKAGLQFGVVECSKLDEATYEYRWDAPTKRIDCVYLE